MPENLLDSPILYSLAITLLHFLWQGCLVALVLKCLLASTSYKKPQLRYFWSTTALLTCLILPVVTFSIIYTPDYYLKIGEQGLSAIAPLDSGQASTVINSDWYQILIDSLPFLSLAWVLTVLISSIKLIFVLKQVGHLSNTATISVNDSLQSRFDELVKPFNLWRKPQLLISLKTEVPMAIGWLKPVVLLPAAMMSGLSSAQLEMLILHELAHIRRHDYLVNFLQTLVEILLFFHPGVRWISKQMRFEREYCSDDIAVKHCGNAIAYAHTLADTASLCHKHRHSTIPAMAMAASGGDLKQRVVRLVDQEHTCTAENDSGKLLASIVILFAILSVFAKPFVDNSIIDWGSGRISLMQSAGELIQHRVNINEQELPENTLAQQLVQQNVVTPKIVKVNEDILTKREQPKLVNVKKSPIIQKQLPVIDKPKQQEKITISHTDHVMSESKENPLELNHVVALNTAAKSQAHNKIVETSNEVRPEPEKSISDLAFERTDSQQAQSQFKNPYANQVASLSDEPLPSTMGLAEFSNAYKQILPPAKTSNHSQELNQHKVTQSVSAKIISSVEPRYPSVAKRKGIEIDVLVKFVINKDGRVSDIEFEDRNKVNYFRNAIRTAMNKWRFIPAKMNDKPIKSQMAKIFSFSLIKN